MSALRDLSQALLATGFSYTAARRQRQARTLLDLLGRVRDVRRIGSAASDLAWVACGRVDCYYELSLNPWDWSAGVLLVNEAGGRAEQRADGVVIAAPHALFDELAALIPVDSQS